MANKKDDKRAGNLIEQVARLYGWHERFEEEKAKTVFRNLLDEPTAKSISALNIRNKILYVQTDNAAARSNLSYQTSALLLQVNNVLGHPVIEEIRLE